MPNKMLSALALLPLLFPAACDMQYDVVNGFTARPACTHCNDGPRRQFHTPQDSRPAASGRAQDARRLTAKTDPPAPCPPFERDQLRQ